MNPFKFLQMHSKASKHTSKFAQISVLTCILSYSHFADANQFSNFFKDSGNLSQNRGSQNEKIYISNEDTKLAQQQSLTACRLPQSIKQPELQRIDYTNNVPVDSYVLAISWSPEFCSQNASQSPDNFQCALNQFEFVVHGLWGQNDKAKSKFDHPRNCAQSVVEPAIIKQMLCVLPGSKLIQGEWQKHGTCTGLTQKDYFSKTQILWSEFKRPTMQALIKDYQLREDARVKGGYEIQAGQLLDAFINKNSTAGIAGKLSKQALSIQVGKGGYLREIFVCYDKNFKYQACKQKGMPDNYTLRIKSN